MRILPGYIVRQVVKPMGATLGIILAVLLLERTSNVINSLLGSGDLLTYVPLMLAFVLPQFASVALPFSLFFGVLMGMQRMERDCELVAIEGSGQGAHNLLATLALLTFVVVILTALSLSYLQPFGRYGRHLLVHSISNLFFQTQLESGVFTQFKNFTIFASRFSRDKTHAEQVFIFSYESGDKWEAVSAASGSLVRGDASRARRLILRDGNQISGRGHAGQGQLEAESVISFDNFQAVIDPNLAGSFRARGNDERELTLPELWRLIEHPPPDLRRSEIRAEFHARVVRILSVIFMPVLAIYLARWRGRLRGRYATACGLVFLIIFNQTLDFGENLVETSTTTPFIGLWLPFLVFGILTVLVFCWGWLRVESGPSFRLFLPPRRAMEPYAADHGSRDDPI